MGGDLGRIGTLDCCFYTREQMSPKLARSLHLHRHGKRRKKGSILVLLAVFLGFRVCTGVFLIEQCLLERETDTKTSPTLDFGCFWFASRLIPRTSSCFFGLLSMLFFCLLEEMECFGRSFLHGLLGAASRR
jgi:hypothetical protein